MWSANVLLYLLFILKQTDWKKSYKYALYKEKLVRISENNKLEAWLILHRYKALDAVKEEVSWHCKHLEAHCNVNLS